MDNDPNDSKQSLESGGGIPTLTVTIKDKNVLYSTYMPFVQGGGLFLPTKNNKYKLGDELVLNLLLLEEVERISVNCKVIWITPIGAQGNRAPGIGVRFMDDRSRIRAKIEDHLVGLLNSDKGTHTM